MRKLPFNNGSSQYEASDKFLAREGLGRAQTEEIVRFLKTNALEYKTRDYDGTQAQEEEKKAMEASKPTCKLIPFTTMLYFETVKIDGPQKKILEFNTALT